MPFLNTKLKKFYIFLEINLGCMRLDCILGVIRSAKGRSSRIQGIGLFNAVFGTARFCFVITKSNKMYHYDIHYAYGDL